MCFVWLELPNVSVPLQPRPPRLQHPLAIGVNLYLPRDPHTGALEPEVRPADSAEK